MKKAITIAVIIACLSAFVVSCKSSIHATGTSQITITVGGDKTASLDVKPATAWLRLKNYMARLFTTRDAVAAIPSVVQTIKLTVDAPDMPAISVSQDVTRTTTPIVTFTVIVPNGAARHFVVDGLDLTDALWYRGETLTDLTGEPLTLSITMRYMGPGIYVSVAHGSDTPSCGALTAPCKSIGHTLATYPTATLPIVVEPGLYSSATESFPIQLNPGTNLLCQASDHSTVFDSTNFNYSGTSALPLILGNTNALIQNCAFTIPSSATMSSLSAAIDDSGTPITVDNVKFTDNNANSAAGDAIYLSGNSTVINSTFTGSPWQEFIYIGNSSAVIRNNTFTSNGLSQTGRAIYVNASSAAPTVTIENNIMDGKFNFNTYYGTRTGIEIYGYLGGVVTNITGNVIKNGEYGIMSYESGTGLLTLNTNTITNTYYTAVNINLGNADILNNMIQQSGTGIYSSSAGTLNIIGNTISQSTGDAVTLTSGFSTVFSNIITRNTGTGIGVVSPVGAGAPAIASITTNTISSNGTGVISATTGSTTIVGNTISQNTGGGIEVSMGSPNIDSNVISSNTGTGINVTSNQGVSITNNTINNNGTGVALDLTYAVINLNTLYCNSIADLYVNYDGTVDATQNSWDHDASTSPTGPISHYDYSTPCDPGTDICYGMASPDFSSPLAAVPASRACR